MYEIRLSPADGLHQSVDYPLVIQYPAEYGVQAGDSARMQLRPALDSAQVLDTLSTATAGITVTGVSGGVGTVRVLLSGELSAAWPITETLDGEVVPRYRRLTAKEAERTGLEAADTLVLPVYGTLIVTAPDGLDRPGPLDAELLFEASATRTP